jgi:hypothetical protein
MYESTRFSAGLIRFGKTLPNSIAEAGIIPKLPAKLSCQEKLLGLGKEQLLQVVEETPSEFRRAN